MPVAVNTNPTVCAVAPIAIKFVFPRYVISYVCPIINDPAATAVFGKLAVPVPDPAPVAVKITPIVLAEAPIDTKLVVPTVTMV